MHCTLNPKRSAYDSLKTCRLEPKLEPRLEPTLEPILETSLVILPRGVFIISAAISGLVFDSCCILGEQPNLYLLYFYLGWIVK